MTKEQAKRHVERILKQRVISYDNFSYQIRWRLNTISVIGKRWTVRIIVEAVITRKYIDNIMMSAARQESLTVQMKGVLTFHLKKKCKDLFGSKVSLRILFSDCIELSLQDMLKQDSLRVTP